MGGCQRWKGAPRDKLKQVMVPADSLSAGIGRGAPGCRALWIRWRVHVTGRGYWRVSACGRCTGQHCCRAGRPASAVAAMAGDSICVWFESRNQWRDQGEKHPPVTHFLLDASTGPSPFSPPLLLPFSAGIPLLSFSLIFLTMGSLESQMPTREGGLPES